MFMYVPGPWPRSASPTHELVQCKPLHLPNGVHDHLDGLGPRCIAQIRRSLLFLQLVNQLAQIGYVQACGDALRLGDVVRAYVAVPRSDGEAWIGWVRSEGDQGGGTDEGGSVEEGTRIQVPQAEGAVLSAGNQDLGGVRYE